MRKHRSYKESLLGDLCDPAEAKAYLDVALDEFESDGDREAFLVALRNVVEARGGLAALSEQAHLNRQNLYRALSPKGNPKLETIGAILHGLGFRLTVEPVERGDKAA